MIDRDLYDCQRLASALRGSLDKQRERLERIEALCRRHAHPGCNSGAHELAVKVLRIIRGESDAD